MKTTTPIRRFSDLASAVAAAPARLGDVRLIAVDGRAGSGKTTFAGRLAAAMRASALSVAEIHTDDLLSGWGDILSFAPRLLEQVLAPLLAGQPAAYYRYDWLAERFQQTPVVVGVPDVLIVEGTASANAEVRSSATLVVRVTAPRDLRLARGMIRDGEALLPQWRRWMADEDDHFTRRAADQADHADVVVNGAPAIVHDPNREYVVADPCAVGVEL
ncbi:MAG: hypothetical protein HKP61_04830 [Dactylosporangium sp.]|nr:hypothetical protein [Dactylosporangium sp.]NNJ60272.1 hypothetical protein [Dactylosporangium sp.]